MATLKVDTITSDTLPTVAITDGLVVSGVSTFHDVVNIETDDNNAFNIIDNSASFRPSINFKKNDSGTVSTLMQIRAEGTNGLDIKDGSGNLRLRVDSSGEIISYNGTLRRNVSDSSFTFTGDTASNTGSNISVYGASHSTLASVVRFRSGATETVRITSDGDVDAATGHLQAQDIKIGLAADRYPIIQRAVQSSGSQNLSITGGSGYSEHTGSNHSLVDAREGAMIQLGGGDPTSDVYGGYIKYYAAGHTSPSGAGNQHVFYTRSGVDTNTERFRIDSSGRVLIGTTVEGSSGADELTINTASGHGGMTIRNDTSSNGNIWFSDGTSGAAEYAGYVQYAHNDDHMVFGTNGSERLRITSDGTCKFDPSAGGTLSITGSSAHTSKIIIGDNANTGAGNCLVEGADGGDYFTIQSNGNVSFASGNGVTFADSATSAILNDYEEGNLNWRLMKQGANTNGSNAGNTVMKYTKIGDTVYLSGWIRTDSTQSSQDGNAKIVDVTTPANAATLPFTPNHTGVLYVGHTRTLDELGEAISIGFVKDSTTVYLYTNDATGDYTPDANSVSTNSQTNIVITFQGSYKTDS